MRLAISNIAWEVADDAAVADLLQHYQIDAIDVAPGKYFPDPAAAEMLAGTRKAEEILPLFVTTQLPAGTAGIVTAAVLAAAMSSMSSAMNSISAVAVTDIYRRHLAPAVFSTTWHGGKLAVRGRDTGFRRAIPRGRYRFHRHRFGGDCV